MAVPAYITPVSDCEHCTHTCGCGCGGLIVTAGTVEVDDTVELQQLSPALSTDPDAELTLDIGGVDDMWSVSTIA